MQYDNTVRLVLLKSIVLKNVCVCVYAETDRSLDRGHSNRKIVKNVVKVSDFVCQ
jgi:hypothetical protein